MVKEVKTKPDQTNWNWWMIVKQLIPESYAVAVTVDVDVLAICQRGDCSSDCCCR